MKILLFVLSLTAFAFVPSMASAAEGAATSAEVMECCNTSCPVCDMAVDKGVAPATFKPTESVKTKHPGIESAKVGFCSEKCKTAYTKEPEKYEGKIVPQWEKSKGNQKGTAKGG